MLVQIQSGVQTLKVFDEKAEDEAFAELTDIEKLMVLAGYEVKGVTKKKLQDFIASLQE